MSCAALLHLSAQVTHMSCAALMRSSERPPIRICRGCDLWLPAEYLVPIKMSRWKKGLPDLLPVALHMLIPK